MSVLVDKSSKVVCQGMTGSQGSYPTEKAIACRTQMVGGISPGRGGTVDLNLPVINKVHAAFVATGW